MADNVTFTAGANSTPPNATQAATDELADGSHAGIAKLAISANGDRTLIPATAADGLLVDVSNASIPVTGGLTDAELRATPLDIDVTASVLPTGASTLAEQQTQTTALQIIDDWDESDRAKVNPIVGQAGVQGGIGDVTATTQRVVEARSTTATQTVVADSASSQTLLASNANRIKCLITNDSSARLYIHFEAEAASTTNYGVSLITNETWEEREYTGEIRGIWASDPGDGAARITEFS